MDLTESGAVTAILSPSTPTTPFHEKHPIAERCFSLSRFVNIPILNFGNNSDTGLGI